MAKAYIGTSGWVYDDWWGRFYPTDIKPEERLEFYAKSFNTVELNASFYHLPQYKTFENWRKKTPDKFVFSAKLSKYITQNLKLKNAQEPTKLFLQEASGLGGKLSVVLVQLPPNFQKDAGRLEDFLKVCRQYVQVGFRNIRDQTRVPPERTPSPRLDRGSDTPQAKLGASDRSIYSAFQPSRPKSSPMPRFAFEFRHESWLNEEVYDILRQHEAGFVIQDSVHWPAAEVVTSGFVYLRFHGPGALYSSNYPDSQLKKWAEKIKRWLIEGLDVYGYFNNDVNAFAVFNALKLREFVEA